MAPKRTRRILLHLVVTAITIIAFFITYPFYYNPARGLLRVSNPIIRRNCIDFSLNKGWIPVVLIVIDGKAEIEALGEENKRIYLEPILLSDVIVINNIKYEKHWIGAPMGFSDSLDLTLPNTLDEKVHYTSPIHVIGTNDIDNPMLIQTNLGLDYFVYTKLTSDDK